MKEKDPMEDFFENLEKVGSKVINKSSSVATKLFKRLATWLDKKANPRT